MIYSNFKNNEGMYIQGSCREVSEECIFLMGELYKKLVGFYGIDKARGIMFDMLKQSIYDNKKRNDINWGISSEEKLAYSD